mgnify:CR=1 FL=1
MHRSYELEITQQLHASDVELEIHFKAPLTDAEEMVEKLGLYPRPYDMPYNYQRKMACSYGWDWGPVTISSGIWKKIELIEWDDAYLSSVAILPTIESEIPTLTIRPIVRGAASGHLIQVRVLDGDETIATETFAADRDKYQRKTLATTWTRRTTALYGSGFSHAGRRSAAI